MPLFWFDAASAVGEGKGKGAAFYTSNDGGEELSGLPTYYFVRQVRKRRKKNEASLFLIL